MVQSQFTLDKLFSSQETGQRITMGASTVDGHLIPPIRRDWTDGETTRGERQ